MVILTVINVIQIDPFTFPLFLSFFRFRFSLPLPWIIKRASYCVHLLLVFLHLLQFILDTAAKSECLKCPSDHVTLFLRTIVVLTIKIQYRLLTLVFKALCVPVSPYIFNFFPLMSQMNIMLRWITCRHACLSLCQPIFTGLVDIWFYPKCP